MVEWEVSDRCVRGFGADGTVELLVDGWRSSAPAVPLPRAVDAALAGETGGLSASADRVRIVGREEPIRARREFAGGRHHLTLSTDPVTVLAFEGEATIEPGSSVRIAFPDPTTVTIGFLEERPDRPTLTVPETPEGLATAVSALAAAHSTAGPDRSRPERRPAMPRLSFGDTPSDSFDPDALAPTLIVPPSAQAVLVAAPLAYYLGASIETDSGVRRLVAPELSREFSPLPEFAEEVADCLRRVFELDCRLRSSPSGDPAVSSLEADADALGRLSPTGRLAAALDAEFDRRLDWHLVTYVDDDPTSGLWLPYVLDRLSLVYPASASTLDPQALLRRNLDEFFRGPVPNVEAVDPSLSAGRDHAWLADGTPIEAYRLVTPEFDVHGRGGEITIDVVCNDPEMRDERAVADTYRDRLDGVPAEIRIHDRLPVAELAAVFERPTDFVHFVGHCERDGLECPDGVLAASDLDSCSARSFFLNACGSYYEGYELVRAGATVGAVTLTRVLDEQAVAVGTTFARLLAAGFPFAPALRLARSEIITGRDYVVVGDGMHAVTPSIGRPAVLEIEPADAGFRLAYDVVTTRAGRRYADPYTGEERPCGETATAVRSREETVAFLSERRLPVRYDGELEWTRELADRLDDEERSV